MQNKTIEFIELENKIGDFIEYWGFKGIEGKIWLNIFVSNEPMCPEDIMNSLSISKALTSNSLKRLVKFKVLEKAHVGNHGTQFYRANKNVTKVIKDVLRMRERRMLNNIHSDIELIINTKSTDNENLDKSKINYLHKMTSRTKTFLDLLLFDVSNSENFLSFGEIKE
jgi:DNA-binding transcriptional regulator GbsR (MarR family)